ncbi:MAG: PQQ-dependent sugar dehydrogenase [Gemmatimonadetes bacterium]|nr:PQQ-dependent sugar dehydrogenase [Gemmatimonadota bacterium]
MTVRRTAVRAAQACLTILIAASCARVQVEQRVLVFAPSDSVSPGAVAAVQGLAEPGALVVDVRQNPSVFVEDSLARYDAVLFLGSSADSLSRRAQVDLERFAQAGGGVVGVGARPSPGWAWFNQAVADTAAGTARRETPGGRAFQTEAPEDYADRRFLNRLRGGIRFAAAAGDLDYSRASTQRVPDPTRFEQQVLSQGTLDEPTELAVASDGRVFWAERKGALKLYEPTTGQTRQIAQLDVTFSGEGYNSENGLIGLALDPRFAENRWLYLNYTDGDTLKHRVSRFTFTGEGIGEEKVMVEVPIDDGCCHTGGSMTFDDRGNLFISYGDNTNPFATSYAPIDNTPGRNLWDARRSSANTQDLRGKILRITPRPDGSYAVPTGNLFSDPAVGRPEIYTMGHRNPYRISYDRRSGFLYWGEVGPDARVDSIYGPKGYDEVNQARRPGNFGWPLLIADNKRYRSRDFVAGTTGELFDPARPANDAPLNTGARVLPPGEPALIWYPYDASREFPLLGEGGRNAMAAFVYHSQDFAGSEVRLPSYYDGKLIHYDWIRGWMMATTLDEQGNYVRMEPFLGHLKFDHPIDTALGPDGALYVLEYGTYWFAKNPTARLTRIVFHPGNRPPSAEIVTSRSVGAAPLDVELSATGSLDFDEGDALSYSWTFSDGTTAQGATVRRTFSQPGVVTARLTVRDASGATGQAETQVQVGNAPPQVTLQLSGNRSFFWDEGGPVSYQVQVSDPEDGSLGSGITPQQVRVTLDYAATAAAQPSVHVGHQQVAERVPAGLTAIQGSDCTGCHAVDRESVGPSFTAISQRHGSRPDAVAYLASKIIGGSAGVWGDRVMPAHPTLAPDVAQEMARYIASLTRAAASLPPQGTVQLDQHQPGSTGAYVLSAIYSDQPRNGIGPLRGTAEVTLRSPVVRAADIGTVEFIGTVPDSTADGTVRPVATVFQGGANLHLGRIDLTGVGGMELQIRSRGHAFTVELRAGGPEGTVLATHPVQAPAAGRWFAVPMSLSAPGEHDLYLVFRSAVEGLGQWNPLLRLDAVRFRRASSP